MGGERAGIRGRRRGVGDFVCSAGNRVLSSWERLIGSRAWVWSWSLATWAFWAMFDDNGRAGLLYRFISAGFSRQSQNTCDYTGHVLYRIRYELDFP